MNIYSVSVSPLPCHGVICRLGESLWLCYSDTALHLLSFPAMLFILPGLWAASKKACDLDLLYEGLVFLCPGGVKAAAQEGFWLSSADELCWHRCSPSKCHQIKPWSRVRCKGRCFRQECQLPFVFWNEHCEQSQSCSLTRVTWVDFVRFWKAVSMYKDLKKNFHNFLFCLLSVKAPCSYLLCCTHHSLEQEVCFISSSVWMHTKCFKK